MKLSDEALELVAARFRSLGDPVRLKILRLLEGGEMSVGSLVSQLGTSQANVSRHLKVLLAAGVLARRVQGTSAFYHMSDPVILKLCATVCSSLEDSLRAQAEGLGFRLEPARSSR
jgi:DNA-binding transcriptional ArsR family regulator